MNGLADSVKKYTKQVKAKSMQMLMASLHTASALQDIKNWQSYKEVLIMPRTMTTTAIEILRRLKASGFDQEVDEETLVDVIQIVAGGDPRTVQQMKTFLSRHKIAWHKVGKVWGVDHTRLEELY